jgi:hypothetical protein
VRYLQVSNQRRPDIATDISVLKTYEDNDVVTILRTWDILCLAKVVDPSSGDMCSLDYLSSMVDSTRTEEFAWDEYLLDLAMAEVQKIHNKKAEPLVLPPGSSKFEFSISGLFAMLGVSFTMFARIHTFALVCFCCISSAHFLLYLCVCV